MITIQNMGHQQMAETGPGLTQHGRGIYADKGLIHIFRSQAIRGKIGQALQLKCMSKEEK